MVNRTYNQDADNPNSDVLADLALALGLVRMLTLLPLHDPALALVEDHIAHAYQGLIDERARRTTEQP